MNGTVSRKKYESLKRKAETWRHEALEAIKEVELERDQLLKEHNTLRHRMTEEVFKHERALVRKSGEIERPKLSLSDYKDRYQEIREDNKELRKSARNRE